MGLLHDCVVLAQEYWLYIFTFGLLLRLARNRYKPVLRDIPGPFLASLSDLWLFFHCVRRKGNQDYLLHRKYNTPLLRLGPNTVSVSDPDAIRIIYGWKRVFPKVRSTR